MAWGYTKTRWVNEQAPAINATNLNKIEGGIEAAHVEGEALAQALSNHTSATNVHGATSAATASRLVIRDSAGRARFAAPSDAADAATKGYVDNTAGTSAATANALVRRDSNGRARFADPNHDQDAATKKWVEELAKPLFATLSNTIQAEALTERSDGNTTGTVLKEFVAPLPGRYRITLDARRSGITGFFSVRYGYADDVKDVRTFPLPTTYQSFTVDTDLILAPFARIQIVVAADEGDRVFVRNARLRYDITNQVPNAQATIN